MPDNEIEDDSEPAAIPADTLDESQETQINRMAGCARMGKWLAYAALIILVVLAISRLISDD